MTGTTPRITASFTLRGTEHTDVDVINPGGWFGKTWLLGIACGFDVDYYIVEADNAGDAIDELVDSGKGDALKIDPADMGDYTEDPENPTYYPAGNYDVPCDLDWLETHGNDRAGFFCTYNVEGWDAPVKPTDLPTALEHLETRAANEEAVKGPGKFEGEPAYVPYYWDAYLNGCADEDEGKTLRFDVTDEDRLIFPGLIGIDVVRLWEDDNGFVNQSDEPIGYESDEYLWDDSDDDDVSADDAVDTSTIDPLDVDSLATVTIPSGFVSLASECHSGMDDLLYAISSTGGLTLGTIRPRTDDGDRHLTDREWHVHLWSMLGSDVFRAGRNLDGRVKERLQAFEAFCEDVEALLRRAYGLEDSDAV